MKKFDYSFREITVGQFEVNFPKIVWDVVLKTNKQLMALNLEAIDPILTEEKLFLLKERLISAFKQKTNPILDGLTLKCLVDAMELTDRRKVFFYRHRLESLDFLRGVSFSQEEYDIKDQIRFYFYWTEPQDWELDQPITNIEREKLGHIELFDVHERPYILINRFEKKTLTYRKFLFELFRSYGFRSDCSVMWSSDCQSEDLGWQGYGQFKDAFSWNISGYGHLWEDIEVIVNPNKKTFLAIATFGCVVDCCGEPFGVYPVSYQGVSQMIGEVKAKRHELLYS